MAELVVRGGPLLASPREYHADGLVHASDGLIVHAGPAEGYRPPPGAEVLDAAGGLIMPGLVNAHCHGPMTLFRGLADDLPLEDWLNLHMFPAEARWVDRDMTRLCGLLAAAELMLGGVTTVGDSYFCADGLAGAYHEAGLRAVVFQGLIGFPAPGAPDPDRGLEECRAFLERWQGKSPLITPAVFAHSPYTCPLGQLVGAARLKRELDCLLHTHLCETAGEVQTVLRDHGRTPVAHLEALGVLEALDTAVHAVWLEPGDPELLAARGVAVAACPESNLKLASGHADLPELLRAGVTVGLGTDGPASNNNLDMLGEVATAARLAKLKAMDPAALPAAEALDLAWAGSAAALGLDGVVGRLAAGYACDLAVLAADAPQLTPLHDPVSALVYAAHGGLVRHTVVQGRVLVRDRRVQSIDLPTVMAGVRELAARVAAGC